MRTICKDIPTYINKANEMRKLTYEEIKYSYYITIIKFYLEREKKVEATVNDDKCHKATEYGLYGGGKISV